MEEVLGEGTEKKEDNLQKDGRRVPGGEDDRKETSTKESKGGL